MKAIMLSQPGGLDHLQSVELADPGQPGPGEIRVRIHASSLNFHDYGVASGRMPTADRRIPMSDGAGVVEAVGDGVDAFAPGDHVVSLFFPTWRDGPPTIADFKTTPGDGVDGYAAEIVVRPAIWFTRAPAGYSHEEAATLTTAGLTAWRALVVRWRPQGGRRRACARDRRRVDLCLAVRPGDGRQRDRHLILGREARARAGQGTFLGTLDSSIANVALPTIAENLHGSPAAAVWVVSGYQLAMAIALLPMATIGERIGAKRLYVFGTLVFALASLGCALAPDLAGLVAARVVQGLGGACTSVVGGALMRQVFPARLLGRGISLFGLVVAISAALGPTVASAILAVADWRWLFAINIPVAGLAIAAAARFLPETPRQPRPFDAIGAVLDALGISALILGVDWLGSGWGRGIAMMLAGAALLAGLLLHQRRRQHPLVPLDLMRIPLFCSYAAQSTAYVSLPFGAAVVAVGFALFGGVGATEPVLLAGAGFAALGAVVSMGRLAV